MQGINQRNHRIHTAYGASFKRQIGLILLTSFQSYRQESTKNIEVSCPFWSMSKIPKLPFFMRSCGIVQPLTFLHHDVHNMK